MPGMDTVTEPPTPPPQPVRQRGERHQAGVTLTAEQAALFDSLIRPEEPGGRLESRANVIRRLALAAVEAGLHR